MNAPAYSPALSHVARTCQGLAKTGVKFQAKKLKLMAAVLLGLGIFSTASADDSIAYWDASGAANPAWGLDSGGVWESCVQFTATKSGPVTTAGDYLYEGASGAYSITYQLWDTLPTTIDIHAFGVPGELGNATVTGASMSTTNGQLILADFTAEHINMTIGQTYYLIAFAGTGSVDWNKSGDGDLSPATFYNTNGGGAGGWTNNQGYKDVGFAVNAVPEPAMYAAGFGAVALISAAYLQRRKSRRAV